MQRQHLNENSNPEKMVVAFHEDTLPTLDSMAAARRQLYLSLKDGPFLMET